MADPNAINCNFEGNPLHEEQLEIVRMLGGALALNTVVDEARALSFINFGEIVASHAQAVAFVRNYAEVSVKRRFKTVVTSAAGYPLDRTYYQTVKGMVGPIDILEPAGRLIVASECSEGLGSAEFVDSQRRLIQLGSDEFLRRILLKSHADIDEWQTQMQLKPMAVGTLQLYSTGLSSGTACPHRRIVHRVGTLRGAREHRSKRRSRCGRHSRRTVRGALLPSGRQLLVDGCSVSC